MADEPKLILDTFNEKTGPAKVNWSERSDTSVAWAALAGDPAAVAEAEKRGLIGASASTASVFHQPGKHDQKRHGRRRGGVNIPAVSSDPSIGPVEAMILNGTHATIDPGHLDALLRDLPNHASGNLEHLQVTGKGNEGIFREHLREITRKKMPQLPESVDAIDKLQKALGDVKTEIIEVDPRELHLTQNELDSVKVGKLYGYIKDGGWDPSSLMYASRENAIVDGHHRFAGACGANATGSNVKVKVLKIDMPIDELLKVVDSVSGKKVGMDTGFSGRGQRFQDEDRPPPPNKNEPWVWLDGKWYKVVTDTGDGVPDDLDYIHDHEKPTTASVIDPAEITRRVFVSKWH
jgi:hypothetical protein